MIQALHHLFLYQVQSVISPIVKGWAGNLFVDIVPSGSFAKGTANNSGTDIDLSVSLSSLTRETLEQIYNSLANEFSNKGYTPCKQNVSIGIKVGSYDVDVIWRNQKGLEFPSFYLEITTINALKYAPLGDLVNNARSAHSLYSNQFISRSNVRCSQRSSNHPR